MLVKHNRTHSLTGPFVCELCDEVFKFESGLDYHKKQKHAPKTAKPASLKVTKSLINNKVQLKCNEKNCIRTFSSSKDLSRHEKLEHSSNTDHYVCTYCRKQYKSKSNFEVHISSHEKGNALQDFEYINKEDFELCDEAEEALEENEMDFEHLDDIPKRNDMNIPDNLLKNIDENIVTIEMIETKRYIGEVCDGKESVNEINSIDPSMFYLNNEEFNNVAVFYDTSNKKELGAESIIVFDEDYALSETVIVDTINDEDVTEKGEDIIKHPYKTAQLTQQSIVEQETVTNNIKVCDICGAQFKNNSHLGRHIQRKHRKEEYKLECDICGKKFLLNYDLKRHMVKFLNKIISSAAVNIVFFLLLFR
jgi:hypothetical protein